MTVYMDPSAQPVAVQPHEGHVLDAIGVRHRLTGEQTADACYLLEVEFEPGDGNRLHIHQREDEIAYVLEGALAVRLRDRTLEIGPSGVGYLPKGTPHAISNPLTTTSRYVFMAVPGGNLELFFDELEAAAQRGPLDAAERDAISAKYGIEWLE